MHLNVEIKARCSDPNRIRAILREQGAEEIGLDHQVDTYFQVNHGRLKLREGNIENSLIQYYRPDQAGPKKSEVSLYQSEPGSTLKEVLTHALGVKAVVDKQREIYFIDNVKLHIDTVEDLGYFLEIEAIDYDGTLGIDYLQDQCEYYMELFGITQDDLLEQSYSDMINA